MRRNWGLSRPPSDEDVAAIHAYVGLAVLAAFAIAVVAIWVHGYV